MPSNWKRASWFLGSILASVILVPGGLVPTEAFPLPPTVRQNALETHETPVRSPGGLGLAGSHLRGPPVGSFDANRGPPDPSATHSGSDAHDTAISLPGNEMLFHASPPAAGWVELRRSPKSKFGATATQSDLEAHDTPVRRA